MIGTLFKKPIQLARSAQSPPGVDPQWFTDPEAFAFNVLEHWFPLGEPLIQMENLYRDVTDRSKYNIKHSYEVTLLTRSDGKEVDIGRVQRKRS